MCQAPDLLIVRGFSSVETQDYPQAIADYKRVIEIDPQSLLGWGNLAWTLYRTGDLTGAIEVGRKAQAIDPTAFWIWANLGLCYAAKGDWQSARPLYETRLSGASETAIKGALTEIEKALRKNPDGAALKQAQVLLKSRLLHK